MIKMRRLISFILSLCILVTILFHGDKVGKFIYDKTGVAYYLNDEQRQELNIPDVSQKEETPKTDENGEPVEQSEPEKEPEIDENLEGNNVIGLTYSSINTDPKTLAIYADCIYRVKIKSISTESTANILYTDCDVRVKKVYKGTEVKQARLYSFGGTIETDKLEPGIFQNAAGKTDESTDTVTGLVDFCLPLEVGEEYIVFADNRSGIITPIAGNLSFFKIEGTKVVRISDKEEEGTKFSMSLYKFVKEYLK